MSISESNLSEIIEHNKYDKNCEDLIIFINKKIDELIERIEDDKVKIFLLEYKLERNQIYSDKCEIMLDLALEKLHETKIYLQEMINC